VGVAVRYGYSQRFFFPLNRIEALTYPQHLASIRVLRKLGFNDEGVRRECGFWKGASHDLRCFSLLRRDWEGAGDVASRPESHGVGDPLTGYLRAKAICAVRHRGRILVIEGHDSCTQERFFYLPGGRIEFGERSGDAVRREMREELCIEIGNLRLMGVLENLFTLDGCPGHEIVFVYDAVLADRTLYGRVSLQGRESNGAIFDAVWLNLDSLGPETPPICPDGVVSLLQPVRRTGGGPKGPPEQ
jgi:ADP-ribose pyrophosphatase YjhB (NUDIX family)